MVVKFKVTATQARHLDHLVARSGMSRSWVVRQALRVGLPEVVRSINERRAADVRPVPRTARPPRSPRRGPRGEGPVMDTWTAGRNAPGRQPQVEYPEGEPE